MEWSSPEFQPAKVFHLAGRILEMKASLSSLTVIQATTDIFVSEDYEEVAKQRVRLAAATIASFDAHTSDDRAPTTPYDLPQSVGVAYQSDVAGRPAREHRGIQLDAVRMVNDTDILVVSQTGGNITRVAPRCVLMDSWANRL